MNTSPHPAAAEHEGDDAVIGKALTASFWIILLLLAVGASAAGVYMLRSDVPEPQQARPVALPKIREAPPIEPPSVPFVDVTEAAGIDFVHENGGAGEKLLPETMGGGGAFFDYNGDGHQDILLVNSCHWPWDERDRLTPATHALYENDGKGNFTDVTKQAGLDLSFYGMGCAAGDYDGDDDVDLFISALGKNHLLRNDGGKFVDVTDAAGVGGADDGWSTSCGWFDFDNDGDLDLFVCQYLKWSREYDAAQDFRLTGGGRAYGRPQNFRGTFPSLYRNDGQGRFTDISAEAGVQVKNPATGVPMGKSLGLAFCDFNEDGCLDVIVTNDTVQNFLFYNRSGVKLEEVGVVSGVAFDTQGQARGAMGVDIGSHRNNREVAIAIGNYANEMTALYVSPGGLSFSDEAVSNGLGPATRLELTFGMLFLDADLDRRLDLVAANGHLEEDINKVQPSQHYEQPAQLFWNCGKEHATEFVSLDADQCGRGLKKPMVGRGAAYADIDSDGDLDLLLIACGGPARLLRNDQSLGHHWLRVKLQGDRANRHGIGAVVEIRQSGEIMRRLVSPTRSYLSQVELPVTFGLGDNDEVASVTVRWPDGTTSKVDNPAVDQTLVVQKPPRVSGPSISE